MRYINLRFTTLLTYFTIDKGGGEVVMKPLWGRSEY